MSGYIEIEHSRLCDCKQGYLSCIEAREWMKNQLGVWEFKYESRGYEFRNTIIWDRRNIVNRIGIFGWPSSYITMGTTFEYILDFILPVKEKPKRNRTKKKDAE